MFQQSCMGVAFIFLSRVERLILTEGGHYKVMVDIMYFSVNRMLMKWRNLSEQVLRRGNKQLQENTKITT
ncbi:hypothetical protein KFK09_023880 [Dendrobium nobile]|uniref:Uncharacterized protein n=1 Tax=Dendrobium nobile TaxID=94219 RepID=A0A8T3AHP9_DENNO|nr:hypothetical protein KFK09_023880 [Dendrobium nobile]